MGRRAERRNPPALHDIPARHAFTAIPVNLSVEPNPHVPYRLVIEANDYLVVDKPAGVSTQPGKGTLTNSLLNGVFHRFGARLQNLGESRDFGLLHRLDKDASGLVLIALTIDAYHALRGQFERRTMEKRYWALVDARPTKPAGVVRKPILEVQAREKTAKIHPAGKPAATAYRVIDSSRTASLLECRIGPGRLHQIRVHLASIKCPILGDRRYAPPIIAERARRLALHAFLLGFDDPTTGERVVATSPWPNDLRNALRAAKLKTPKADLEPNSTRLVEPTDEESRTESGGDADEQAARPPTP